MINIVNLMPDLEPDEMAYVQNIVQDMTDGQVQQFASIYRSRRKEPLLVLATALVGFFGVAGIHRFLLGKIGMGILYLLTGGLCFIGTIIDLINYKRMAFEYNVREAQLVRAMMGSGFNPMY